MTDDETSAFSRLMDQFASGADERTPLSIVTATDVIGRDSGGLRIAVPTRPRADRCDSTGYNLWRPIDPPLIRV